MYNLKNQKNKLTEEEILIVKKKRNTIIMIFIPILILIIIFGSYVKDNAINNPPSDKIINCIAEKTELYISRTCGHCQTQKNILGEHLNQFNVIDCTSEKEKCKNIRSIPSWIIKDKIYSGVKGWNLLKELTNCGFV